MQEAIGARMSVPGGGRRLFEHDEQLLELRLTECAGTESGVVLATYEPA